MYLLRLDLPNSRMADCTASMTISCGPILLARGVRSALALDTDEPVGYEVDQQRGENCHGNLDEHLADEVWRGVVRTLPNGPVSRRPTGAEITRAHVLWSMLWVASHVLCGPAGHCLLPRNRVACSMGHHPRARRCASIPWHTRAGRSAAREGSSATPAGNTATIAELSWSPRAPLGALLSASDARPSDGRHTTQTQSRFAAVDATFRH